MPLKPGIAAELRAWCTDRVGPEEWNRKNPRQRIVVSMHAVLKRVREMSKTKDQRIADTAPKALREELRREAATLR